MEIVNLVVVGAVVSWGVGVGAGCSILGTVNAGYEAPIAGEAVEGHRGGLIELHGGAGVADLDVGGVGLDVSLRAKLAERQQQVGLGLGLYGVILAPEGFGALARTNVNLAQFENWNDHPYFGVGSVSGELGFLIALEGNNGFDPVGVSQWRGGSCLVISGHVGYDVRVHATPPPGGWWGVSVGWGLVSTVSNM